MIVVVGLPAYADSPDGEKCAGGMAVDIAAAAKRADTEVELVGKVGEDGAGDAVVMALGRLGIGHAALLRDPVRPTPVLMAVPSSDDGRAEVDADSPLPALLPANPTERPGLDAGDIEVALRYLPQASVIVVAEPLPEEALQVATDAAAFAEARLVIVVPSGSDVPILSGDATVLEAPADDDGSFGAMVGTFASSLAAGRDPAVAFREAIVASGWESAGS
jgi:sugar/nucleoside kinase (ribokinase family)